MKSQNSITPGFRNKGRVQQKSFVMLIIFLIVFIVFSIGCSVSIGQVTISLGDTFRILLYKALV